jgi:hypothetical protein
MQHPHVCSYAFYLLLLLSQVLRRSSVGVIAPFLDPHQDVISSIEGTRMRLLALDAFVPGASTLLANLLRSSGPTAGFAGGPRHSSSSLKSSLKRNNNNHNSRSSSPLASRDDGGGVAAVQRSLWGVELLAQSLQSLSLSSRDGGASSADGAATMAGRRWLREYADGAHCELFFCRAGPPLAGLRFSNAAEQVYAATGAMLVGVMQVGALSSKSATCSPFVVTVLPSDSYALHRAAKSVCCRSHMFCCLNQNYALSVGS